MSDTPIYDEVYRRLAHPVDLPAPQPAGEQPTCYPPLPDGPGYGRHATPIQPDRRADRRP